MKEILNKKEKGYSKIRVIFATLCFAVGVFLLLLNPIRNIMLSNKVDNMYTAASGLSAEEFAKNAQTEASYDYSDVQPVSMENVIEAAKTKVNVPSIGLISVPELGIKLSINHGATNVTMLYGAGTIKPQKMGEGNYALASHSVNSYGGENMLFTPLWRAQKGMKVYLTDGAKVYTYTIDETFMVSPSDTWVLDETKDSTVTLITCDVSTFKRVIIKGKLDSVKSMDDTDESVLKSFNLAARTF